MLAAFATSLPDPRFVIENFEPAYLKLQREGVLQRRVEQARKELEDCCACPRNCHINRLNDERKVCNTGRHAIVSSAFAHFGEEDCLRGWKGSGTIFFGMCNLRCVFCQNWDISQKHHGKVCEAEEIAELMLALQRQGCHNINLVTPEHVAPQVVEAIALAVPGGLHLPIVYNTSSYDAIASLRLMEGIVDIYMPDFKFWHRETARHLGKAKDYPEHARNAIKEMHRQVGILRTGKDGLAKRGVLVRHLIMPNMTDETRAICNWLASNISTDTYLNLMDQYRPQYQVTELAKYGSIDRCPNREELVQSKRIAKEAGLWRFDTRY